MNPVPEIFNAAAYFVDRHLDEGRGNSIAIECGDRRITYRTLHERVNRAGSALRDQLGVRPEERIMLLLLDGPEAPCRCRRTRCGLPMITSTS